MALLDDISLAVGRPAVLFPVLTPNPAPAWPTVAGLVAQLLDTFDTGADGAISVAEIVGAMDPSGRLSDDLTPGVERLFGLIDANADGIATRSELSTTLGRLDTNGDGSLSPADLGPELAHAGLAPLLAVMLTGLPTLPASPKPPPVPRAPTVDEVADALMARLDRDDDGGITLAELQSLLSPARPPARLGAALAELVAAVDTDASGAMELDEVAAAVASLDADGNSILDRHDHLPGPPADEGVDLIGILLPRLRDFDAAALLEG